MALFIMILRKMAQNRWLVASLFLGLLMTVALVSSMPIYSEAILSRMLVKDLEKMQTEQNVYPGSYSARISFADQTPEERRQILSDLDRYMKNGAAPQFGLPVKELVARRETRLVTATPETGTKADLERNTSARFASYSGMTDHIKLTDGRMPADHAVDGVYEVLLTDGALREFRAVLGQTFTLKSNGKPLPIRVKPVGVFDKKTDSDPYFEDAALSGFDHVFIIDENLFTRDMVDKSVVPVVSAGWYFVLDYSKMELRNVNDFLQTDKAIRKAVQSKIRGVLPEYKVPALETIESYFDRAKQLKTFMWALNVPVLIMLGFYTFMVANLIADRQKNEIAVLRSRGAARWQIAASFAAEGVLLGAAALAVGPLLGLLLTEVLGASNGFLSFVQRARLPVHLNAQAYQFGAAAAAASFVMLMIPVLLATRVTIVGHKQQLARLARTPLWHKLFLDVVALAVSIYGLYTFRQRMKDVRSLGLNADDLNLDPLQFIVPAVFIVGGGLLLLRLYPYALRLVYALGRKWWSPPLYATLIQVGRSASQYQFLMIFLVLTIATGVFSASAARTINGNTADRIRYAGGADIVMTATWPNDKPPPPPPGAPQASAAPEPKVVHYLEPAFEPFETLPGVASAAKVFVKNGASFSVGEANGTATLMGIDTDAFGRTAWFRDGLLPHPLYEYLNLIATDSKAVLVSRTLADAKKVKPGDTIWIGWDNVQAQPFVVYGIVNYFPTFNPNPPTGSVDVSDEDAKANAPMLIVGHLSRIQLQLALEPYQVWLRMKPGFSAAELYDAIRERKLPVESLRNTPAELTKAKNDPFLMALNGILTLGFIISILVSFAGFLLYWVLSLRGRTLQNGVFRAIGLSVRHLVGMLAAEQLLTSGAAVLIGVAVGNLASRLFVPNFQIAFNPSSLVPPFRVQFDAADFVRLYALVAAMLLVGLGILGFMLSRLRIHQALKLGED